ncbi:MAG: carbohydrate ABC transporter permease, partial [Pseudomonadota bacterium]
MTDRDHLARLKWQRRFLYALVIALIVVIMFPFFWLLTMSFKTDTDIFAFPPKIFFQPTLENYIALWDTDFRHSFGNSAMASVVSTVLAMIIGTPGAYALSRTMIKREGQLSLLILASRM